MEHAKLGDRTRNIAAEDAYRAAWKVWRATCDDLERLPLEAEMDRLQPFIAVSPADPRWVEFKAILDGYREYWEAVPSIALANLEDNMRGRI